MNYKCLWSSNKVNNKKMNIIFFPYGGGGIPSFFQWVQDLEEYANCYVVELPGRGNRFNEEPYTDIKRVIAELTPSILNLKEPFIFVGHSMGALIAYELTCHLQDNYDLKPLRLVVSGCSSPSFPKPLKKSSDLSEDEFIDRLKKINGSNNEIVNNSELLEVVMPMLRADFALCDNYAYNNRVEKVTCPITAFCGNKDIFAPLASVECWRDLTNNSFSVKVFDGEHFFIKDRYQEVLNFLIELVEIEIDEKGVKLKGYA